MEHDENDSELLQQWSTQPATSLHVEEEVASDNKAHHGSEGEVGSNHEDSENSDVDTEPCGTDSSGLGPDSSKCEALCCGTSDILLANPEIRPCLAKQSH